MPKPSTPPRLFVALLRLFCKPKFVSHIEGDLRELYEERLARHGRITANLRFILDVLLLFRPGIIRSPSLASNPLNHMLLNNHFKIGWRNLLRRKAFTAIHVVGLSVGICASFILFNLIRYELSFDSFHKDSDRLYRFVSELTESTGDKVRFTRNAVASFTQAPELTGVEEISGVIPYNVKITLPGSGQKSFESRSNGKHFTTTVITGPEYFRIFQYQWLAGSANTALRNPSTVVLTKSRAKTYFGDVTPVDAIGKTVFYGDTTGYIVSGIVDDWNANTDLAFTDFISLATLQTTLKNTFDEESWNQRSMNAWVFVKLQAGTSPDRIESQLEGFVKNTAPPDVKVQLLLQPLAEIHFDDTIIENPVRTAHLPTLYTLIAIALFILVLAIVNFITLSMAQSFQRAKEVGIRKVLGSTRTILVSQFMVEALLVTTLSISLALMLIHPTTNYFHSYFPEGYVLNLFDPSIAIFIIVTLILVVAGGALYPAIHLASFEPITTMKGLRSRGTGNSWSVRAYLTVFQFAVSIIFIICSIVVTTQLQYTREKDLGFSSEAIITFDTPRGERPGKVRAFAERLKQMREIQQVALQWLSPMTDNPRGMKLKFRKTDQKDFWVAQVAGDENYIPLYNITLLAGRNLLPADSVREIVINESLCKMAGFTDPLDAIGAVLYWEDRPYPIVGVVSDFHTESLHQPISPLCIINRPDREGSIAVKLLPGKDMTSLHATLLSIEQEWNKFYSEPLAYRFYDETLQLLYEKDRRTATLINIAMAIAISISCIGLFGLSLFNTQRRVKEIGIRKILGAGVATIVKMLTSEIFILVFVALTIATPIAWYCSDLWLSNFAYHITFSWWMISFAGAAALFIALLTVSYQVAKSALVNPVESIKSE